MFSYLSPETRVRQEHPLRRIRVMVDEVLRGMSGLFDQMYSEVGRPSIAPEKLLRALSTSNRSPALCRSSPSAIWLRAELPVQRINTRCFCMDQLTCSAGNQCRVRL